MAYDAANQRVVLFGGSLGSQFQDTWTYDGNTWQQVLTLLTPAARSNHAMAYDPVRGRVVLFGGRSGNQRKSDTWEFDGLTWQQMMPANSPPARRDHGMEWDSTRQRVVLFGGSSNAGYVNDVWTWDGVDWTQDPAPAGALPDRRYEFGTAFDQARGELVVFGGTAVNHSWWKTAETWVYGVTPAVADESGVACSAGEFTPALDAFGYPHIGNPSFALDVSDAEPGSPCAFAFAASGATSSVVGCTLYLGAPIVALPGVVNAFGWTSLGLPIPFAPTLLGLPLHAQVIGVRPATSPFGWWMTPALVMQIGE